MTVTLPAEMMALLKSSVAGGEYATTSEVVREALREWSRRRSDDQRDLEALRAAIKVGEESGPGIPADEAFAEIRRRIVERRVNR